jgi:hypothetical protein
VSGLEEKDEADESKERKGAGIIEERGEDKRTKRRGEDVKEDRVESGRPERREGGKIRKRREEGDNESWRKGEERIARSKERDSSQVRDKMASAGAGTDLDDHGNDRRKKFFRIRARTVPPTRPAKGSIHPTRLRCCFRARIVLDDCRSSAASWMDSATASRTSCSTSRLVNALSWHTSNRPVIGFACTTSTPGACRSLLSSNSVTRGLVRIVPISQR